MVGLKISNSPYIKSKLGYSYFYLTNGTEIRSFGHVEGGLMSLSGCLYSLDDCKVIYPERILSFAEELSLIGGAK